MKKLLFVLLPAAVFITLFAFTYNDDQLDKLLANLEKLAGDAPQEKIHLQFDKPYYSLGEDIFFKAYVVDAGHNMLSSQSKLLYVDLLNDRDSVKKTLLLPIVNGTANANIHLSDTLLSAGSYHIYAYTKWMLNFSSDFFFKKDVSIVSAKHGTVRSDIKYDAQVTTAGKQLTTEIVYKTDDKPYANQPVSYTIQANGKVLTSGKAVTNSEGKVIISDLIKGDNQSANLVVHTRINPTEDTGSDHDFVIKPLAGNADVQFFPEGGHLVNGLRTKIAYKAVKPNGDSEDISGYITDNSGEHLAEFKADHAGMGLFALQPVTGKTYTAVVTHRDGSESKYPLPKADENGYILNVNRVGTDSLSVRIAASPTLVNGREVILIAQSNGITQFVAKTKVDQASNVSLVSSKKFPTGITQFTLFSPDYAPVAERLVFVDHNDQLRAEITPDKTIYAKRGKVKLDFNVADAYAEPVVGSFSISVTDNNKVKFNEDGETTILSNLLLTSDIKGRVERPNYYFNPANPDRLKHLDVLLLTQGWRRFSWTDVAAGKFPSIIYKPEQSLTVSGNIKTLSNKPISKGQVTLLAKTAAGPMIIDTTADENGHFVFNDLDFVDTTRLVVKAHDVKKSANVKIELDKKTRIPYVSNAGAGSAAEGNLAEYMKYSQTRFDEMSRFGLFNNTINLKEVKIASKKNFYANKIIPNSVNKSPGSADIVIKLAEIEKENINLLQLFYGRPGIYIKSDMVYMVGHVISITRPGGVPMMILMDGAQIEPSTLKLMTAQDIAGVEILTSGSNTAIYGDAGYWGVILLTTRRGGEGITPPELLDVAHYMPNGYASTKQFYSPKYDSPNDQSKMIDLRSTIYWDGDIVTDAAGKASVTFFNADDAGKYKVIMEGMDTKGKLLRKTITYEVK